MNPETPYTIALSHNEMVALIKYHAAKNRAIPKEVGKISLKLSTDGIASAKNLKSLHAEAKGILEYHTTRARGILSLIKS